MPVKLNLLPEELSVNKGLASVLKTIRGINIILIVTFIISSLGMGGFFIFSKISFSNLQSKVNTLKTQVKAQESSEQQLILIKDRLSKISSLKTIPNAEKSIVNIDNIVNTNILPDTRAGEISVSPISVNLSLIVASNKDLSTLIGSIKNTDMFSTVELSNLSYSPLSGYTAEITLK